MLNAIRRILLGRDFARQTALLDRLIITVASLAETIGRMNASAARATAGDAKTAAMAVEALATGEVLKMVVGALMAHAANGQAPHPDAPRQIALFLEMANKTADSLTATTGIEGVHPYYDCIRALKGFAEIRTSRL